MGVIVDISCRSCRADWQCMTGCGLMHGTLEHVADLFPDEMKQEILEYGKQAEIPLFDFGYRLAVCPDCGGMVSVPVVRMLETYQAYVGPCPDCGKPVRLARDLSKTACPVCHEKSLEVKETGCWD
ncbi:MAG: hypothetical protein HFI45_12610 [Lachnospiraceae bacterium]|nr:hypothetical protein [Lachnospiraceae bacterium]